MTTKYYKIAFILLFLLYSGLAILPSANPAVLHRYHISTLEARELSASVVIPLGIIWGIAMYGFVKIKSYAALIRSSKDGNAFNNISNGLLYLALGPLAASTIASCLNLVVKKHANWQGAITITNNYIGLVVMAIGLALIAGGAEQLVGLVRKRPSRHEQRNIVLVFIVLSTLYGYLITREPLSSGRSPGFYMTPLLVLVTLAIPYLYFWYRGILGAYYIYHYQKHISGRIYKNSLLFVATGIATVIITSIFVRILATASANLGELKLGPLLLVIYGFLIISTAGYSLIAIGAKHLRKIEEV